MSKENKANAVGEKESGHLRSIGAREGDQRLEREICPSLVTVQFVMSTSFSLSEFVFHLLKPVY